MFRKEKPVFFAKIIVIALLSYSVAKLIEARYFGEGLSFFFWKLENFLKI